MTNSKLSGKDMAKIFSDFINTANQSDCLDFSKAVASDHRTLQEDSFLLFLKCINEWSESYKSQNFDARNQYSTMASNIMIKSLVEKGIY